MDDQQLQGLFLDNGFTQIDLDKDYKKIKEIFVGFVLNEYFSGLDTQSQSDLMSNLDPSIEANRRKLAERVDQHMKEHVAEFKPTKSMGDIVNEVRDYYLNH